MVRLRSPQVPISQKGFAKLLLIPGVVILLIALFVLQDAFAPADKRMIFKAQLTSQTNTNSNSKPTLLTTIYKNSLSVNWQKAEFEIRNRDNPSAPAETKAMYKVSDVNYCNAGDKKMLLDLYANGPLKPGSGRPMVMYIFGGGMIAGDKSKIDTDAAKVIAGLVENDFIVAAPNYRLAPQYKYPAMIQDLMCADRFLRYYSYGIGGDQNKVGVYGISVGKGVRMHQTKKLPEPI
ncbi:alpha/beta hydrolase [Patescibacteria group bacterium]|nr:alpha/beta hydrolase [Patescibacteria group bacterium]